MRRTIIATLTALAVTTAGAFAEVRRMDDTRLAFLRFGIFCVGPTIDQSAAPDTITGVVDNVEESSLVRSVSVVPANLGLTFGVEFQGLPGVNGSLTLFTIHPPMGSTGTTRQTWVSGIGDADSTSIFYTFDEPWERVIGEWRMEAEYQGELIYSVAFQVVPGGTAPSGNCAAPPLLS